MKSKRAFTLIELLTVIAIIAILAVMVFVVSGPFQRTAQMTHAMNNMRQLGSGLMTYCGSHDGQLPLPGVMNPTFGVIGSAEEVDAWYNVIPKAAGSRAISDYRESRDFYKKSNPLFVPAAKYPSNPTRPLFAITMNSRLHQEDVPAESVRLANFGATAATIILFESGLPGEPTLPGQPQYAGSANGGPDTVAARYKRSDSTRLEDVREAVTNLLFADGHSEALKVKDVLNTNGQGYYPQLPQNGGLGKVCWTLDPETKP